MLKTNKYLPLWTVCLLTLSACNSSDSLSVDPVNQDKTPIELTVGIVGEDSTTPHALTRTVTTTDSPYGHAASAFSSPTSLYMVMKSEHTDYATDNTKDPKYSRTIGTVVANNQNVSFASGYERYWEDSYSRDSKVSVYSACVPGSSTALTIGGASTYNQNDYAWPTTIINPTITWPLSGTSASQNATFLTAQDLCFSNNVSNLPNPDNRIAFNTTTNKFEARQLIFHHALTKVTFKIKKGDGFGTGEGVFTFTNASENIVLTGFNTSGTLDISTGEFTVPPITGTADISLLADTHTDADVTAGYSHVLTCLMLPGSALTSTATNEVYFTIDNNKYHITKSQLATALSGKTVGTNSTTALTIGSKMRPGVHYIFTLTVSKKGIDKLSASVVDWETTTADEITPTNARITVSLLDNGTHQTGLAGFNLYRKASEAETIKDDFIDYTWTTGYVGNKATLTENSTGSGVYTAIVAASNPATPWYWPNNKTYYHFRAVMPLNHTVTTDAENGDYISLTGAIAPFTDVCWGAPFKTTTGTLTYSTTSGFDNTSGESHQIYQAIGPTSEAITLQIFHMMSDVTIQLTTTEGTDAVTLEGATISLSNIYPTGTVKLGNGLITPTGTPTNAGGNVNSEYKLHYGFVPQSLEGVVLTITTADNNQYKITMPERTATIANSAITNPYTETSSGSGKYTINAWYPNFQYTYTFKLTKTGVESISATIANWGTVTADQEEIQIQ